MREYMEGTEALKKLQVYHKPCPLSCPQSPPGTAQEQKSHCQPCKRKEPGTPRNVLYSVPIGISDGPGFRAVGARINIRLKRKPRTAGTVVKCQFLAKTPLIARFPPKPSAHQLLVVSSPRPHWFQLIALNLVSKAQPLTDVPYVGPVFGVSKTSMSGFVAVGPHCALLKTCCRIGGRNHHSRYRAMIVCDTCTQRSAIVFLTPGHLAGQMHTPRIHFEEHMHRENSLPTICSLPY